MNEAMAVPKKFQEILSKYSEEQIIERLSSFLSESRMEKIEQVLQNRLPALQVAIESPALVHNALASIRSSEAFGLFNVHIISSEMKRTSGKGTTQGAWKWTFLQKHKTLDSFAKMAKEENFKIAGASPRASLDLEKIPIKEPLILLFGNEDRGLSEEALSMCDYKFQIPMQGMMESLNLSVAVAISVYETASRLRKEPNIHLNPMKFKILKAIYYIQAIGMEKAKSILKKLLKD